MVSMNRIFIVILIILLNGCVPRLLTTNSPLVLDLKKNLEIQSENTIKLSKNFDKMAEKIGVDVPSITPELKDALKQLQADNDKKFDLFSKQILDMLKPLITAGLGSIGVPSPVANAGIGLVEAALGGTTLATVTKLGSDFLANRRRKKDDEEWEEHCEDMKQKLDEEKKAYEQKLREEAEKEKEGIRLRLEREKEELRIKGLVKAETMIYIDNEAQEKFEKARERAIKNLKARGEI